MNRQQLIAKAQRIVDTRRNDALAQADALHKALRADAVWAQNERALKQAQVDLVMGRGNADDLKRQINSLTRKQNRLLASKGLTAADLQPKYVCTKCNDSGYVNGAMCGCLQKEIRNLIIADSNVINVNYTFDASTETDKHNLAIYKKARQICDGQGNILLIGGTGCGKTYLLTACANHCAQTDKSTLFVTAYSLNATLLDAHLSDTATCQAVLDSLVDVDVLVIDDLGTENVYKNVTAEYLFSIINERIARGKQTFVSTNLSLAALRQRYDERLFSRLVDANRCFVAQLQGADKRFPRPNA